MQVIMHRKHATNLTSWERIAFAVGGAYLVTNGITKRNSWSMACAATGASFIRAAITGHSFLYEMLGIRNAPLGQGAPTTSVPYELGVRVDESIVINRPHQDVYRFWRDFSNLPRFMQHVDSVRNIGSTHSHWVVKAPGSRQAEWIAELYNDIPGRLIAWRTLPGADVAHAGSVQFRNTREGRATELRVELQYNPPGGALGAVVAYLFGQEPGQQIHEDLQELKRLMESGDMAGKDMVDEALEESFPASDAPAYT